MSRLSKRHSTNRPASSDAPSINCPPQSTCKHMQAHASPAKYLPEPKPKCQRTGRQLGLHDSKTSTERRLECMNQTISLSCPVLSCPVLSCPVLSCPTDLPGHPLRSAYLASFTFRHSASGHNSSHEVNNHRDLSPSGKASTGFPIIPLREEKTTRIPSQRALLP